MPLNVKRICLSLICLWFVCACNNSAKKGDLKSEHNDTIQVEPKQDSVSPKKQRPIHTDSLIQKVILILNGQKLIETLGDSAFRCLTMLSGDTIVPYDDSYAFIEFPDINHDGYKDIRVYRMTNVPNICDNYFFDKTTKTYNLIKGCDLDIISVPGTDLFFTWGVSGCAGMDWESYLCKIENWAEVDIGYIEAKDCGDEDDGVRICIVNSDDKKKLIKKVTLKDFGYKNIDDYDDFLRKYWAKHYKEFEK